jgi:hypothetical protein
VLVQRILNVVVNGKKGKLLSRAVANGKAKEKARWTCKDGPVNMDV